jgi:hypothetical protein
MATHLTPEPGCDHRGFVLQSDKQARQSAVDRIVKLTGLASAIHDMIEEEQRLIGSAVPYATHRYDDQFSALCRAAYGVFLVDELHEMGAPRGVVEDSPRVLVLDQRGIGPASCMEAAE